MALSCVNVRPMAEIFAEVRWSTSSDDTAFRQPHGTALKDGVAYYRSFNRFVWMPAPPGADWGGRPIGDWLSCG